MSRCRKHMVRTFQRRRRLKVAGLLVLLPTRKQVPLAAVGLLVLRLPRRRVARLLVRLLRAFTCRRLAEGLLVPSPPCRHFLSLRNSQFDIRHLRRLWCQLCAHFETRQLDRRRHRSHRRRVPVGLQFPRTFRCRPVQQGRKPVGLLVLRAHLLPAARPARTNGLTNRFRLGRPQRLQWKWTSLLCRFLLCRLSKRQWVRLVRLPRCRQSCSPFQ